MTEQIPERRVLALIDATAPGAPDHLGLVAAACRIAGAVRGRAGALVLGYAAGAPAAHALGAVSVWHVPMAAMPLEPDQAASAFLSALRQPEIWDAGDIDLILLPTSPAGEEIAARLAVDLNGALLGPSAELALTPAGVCARRPAFGGRAELALDTTTRPGLATLRCAGAVVETGGAPGMDDIFPLPLAAVPEPALTLERREVAEQAMALEGARVVVSGGRGVGGEAGFVTLGALAEQLGGALGGSLPTVDAGWIPVSRQVGQSGKFVTPEIYVAVGISGTPQHLAGIGPATRIVAINADAEADIFRFADIGIVGDWQEVVPALIARLRG